MKKIPLNNGKYAIVDDEDYPLLSRLSWHLLKSKNKRTSVVSEIVSTRMFDTSGKSHYFPMTRFLMRLKPNRVIVHKNNNQLDCRKCNLVQVLPSFKIHMQSKYQNTYSKYRGVHFDKYKERKYKSAKKLWRSDICKDGISYYLGIYETEEEAALAYNKKARELYGEFAYQNKIE